MEREYSRVDILRNSTYLLLRLGFQARQRGYRYLREAVLISCIEPETLNSVTKLLYPELARRFDTTDKQIEGAIRNSIETAWARGKKEAMEIVFGSMYKNTDERPTNTEVIEAIVKSVILSENARCGAETRQ